LNETITNQFSTTVIAETSMDRATVAVVQVGTVVGDCKRCLEKVEAYCEEAMREGARVAVFPEAFIGGYPKGLNFGTHIGSRSAEGREEFRRYYDEAIEVPSDETALLGQIAATHKVYLVIGVVERVLGTLYCSVLFFGSDGSVQGKHRKLMPTGSERLIWGLGDGSTMPAITTPYGTLGAAICWENYMPLFRAAMYKKGVSLWCAPTVDDRDTWQATMRHIAVEGRCFVLSACQYLLRSDCPEDYHPVQGDDPATALIKGGSVILSPSGEVLAGPLYGGEGVLVAELDLKEIARGKFDLDVVGHYARPDVFTLSVDERPKQSILFEKE
jgi:predicted amidohydrolase